MAEWGDALCLGCEEAAITREGRCATCGRTYRVEGNTLRMTEEDDAFYEGAYRAQVHFGKEQLSTLAGRIGLKFVNYGYVDAVTCAVRPGSKVLELGAGGGVRLFGQLYAVSAVDLSVSSLSGAPKEYEACIQADALRVNFAPGSFDAIVSSCFFEHFTAAQKKELLARAHRWLRHGGLLVFLFDTKSSNPLFRWLEQDPLLYRKAMVEHDGHVGLESLSANELAIRSAGFKSEKVVGLNRTLQHLPVYTWLRSYAGRAAVFEWIYRASLFVAEKPFLNRAFTASIHVFDSSIGRWFPRDWSRLCLGVWRRSDDHAKG